MRFSIDVDGADAMALKFANMPGVVNEMVALRMGELGDYLTGYIRDDELSGQILQERSGALKASIYSSVESSGKIVVLTVGSTGTDYGAILNAGGVTGPHDIYPNKASALHFFWAGQEWFMKVVHHPGSHIPAFNYLGQAISDNRRLIQSWIADAVNEGIGKS